MIISPALLARRLFSQRQFLTLYKEVRDYLPRAQYKDFLRSWIINNLLVGPRKRKRFELKNKCTLPAVINLSPTERCNLNCTGCYAASYGRNHEMTLSEIETIIQQAKELGIYFIGFLGGEPFLRKDLFSIIQKHKDVAFRISTNGTILDQEILDGLRNCGNLVVFLSLEGFEAHTDMWRGPGAYAKILETMATLKRERILFGFSLLLHSENLALAISEQFLDSMRDAGCKFGLYFPYGPIGDNARYDLALSEEQIQNTFKKLTALEDKYSMLLLDMLKRIVLQAMTLGIPSVGIIGGEPLLLPHVLDLFRQFPHTGFYLVTNGTRVTPEIIAELKELPNVITTFSVDGFEKTNDELRGAGVFAKIENSMTLMSQAGLAFGFSTTVHRKNVHEVISEQYLDFMIDQGCLFGAFLPYIPVGSTPMYDLVCRRDEVQEYYRQLDVFGMTRPILILKEGYSDGTFLNSGCGAAHTMHVTEMGEVEPCNGIEFSTDNLNVSTVEDAFFSDYFRDIRKLHDKNSRKCLVIAEPESVLEVVKKHNAQPTHIGALDHLEHYATFVRDHRVYAGGKSETTLQ